MAIAESGAVPIYQIWTVPASSRRDSMMQFLDTNLTAAGMTVTNKFASSVLFTPFNLNPTDGETFTINGRVYTLRNVLAVADDIKIGASPGETFGNITAAINLDAGAGTKYEASTTINADVSATDTLQGGFPASRMEGKDATKTGLAVSDTGANLSWTSSTLAEPGLDIVTATTSAFQRGEWRVFYNVDSSGGITKFEMYTRDRSTLVEVGRIDGNGDDNPMLNTGVQWTLIADRYQFVFFANGLPNENAAGVLMCVPFISDRFSPNKITGATNTTPIEITTQDPHEYLSGETAKILYVEGNTAANNVWTITKTGESAFTLNGSVGNGTFTGTDGLVANTTTQKKEFLEVCIGNGSNAVGAFLTFRERSDFGTTGGSMIRDGVLFPKSAFWAYGLAYTLLPVYTAAQSPVWINQALFGGEPWIGVSNAPGATDLELGVMFWDCFQSQTSTQGEFQTTADGKTWMNVMHLSDADAGAPRTFLALWFRIA